MCVLADLLFTAACQPADLQLGHRFRFNTLTYNTHCLFVMIQRETALVLENVVALKRAVLLYVDLYFMYCPFKSVSGACAAENFTAIVHFTPSMISGFQVWWIHQSPAYIIITLK